MMCFLCILQEVLLVLFHKRLFIPLIQGIDSIEFFSPKLRELYLESPLFFAINYPLYQPPIGLLSADFKYELPTPNLRLQRCFECDIHGLTSLCIPCTDMSSIIISKIVLKHYAICFACFKL